MKFIIDAQLPKSLTHLFVQQGYDAIHTLDLPDQNTTTDTEIINIASTQKRVVITKDNDFLDSLLLSQKQKNW